MVVTFRGTTAAGLAVMEQQETAKSLAAAVEAAAKRGREMAAETLAVALAGKAPGFAQRSGNC